MNTTDGQKIRQLALAILKELLAEMPCLIADHYFEMMRERGFTENEAARNCGACIRTGAANDWMQKTNLCVNSRKNHSNLQKVWVSRLFKDGTDAKPVILFWEKRGFALPMAELQLWKQMQAQKAV